jgi:hypothetical protein
MAEELLEINEADEVISVNEPVEEFKDENASNPLFVYLQNAFSKVKVDEYFASLNAEQQKFLSAFVAGFQSAIGKNIVGVYEFSYIEGFHFTQEILQTVNVVLRPIEVTDLEMKFVVVAQY